jgi:hypothetical protein
MRTSVFSPGASIALVISVIAGLTGTASVSAEDLSSPGFMGELAILVEMEPSMAVDVGVSATPPAGGKTVLRQSVPARDRAETYRTGELFRNTRVALPLLVADLEPRTTVARPMSGRSVGARPMAARPDLPIDPVPSMTVPQRDFSRW